MGNQESVDDGSQKIFMYGEQKDIKLCKQLSGQIKKQCVKMYGPPDHTSKVHALRTLQYILKTKLGRKCSNYDHHGGMFCCKIPLPQQDLFITQT